MADTYVSGANVIGSAVITGGTINGQSVANMPTNAQAAAVAALAAGNIGTITSGSISGSVVAPATAVSPGTMPATDKAKMDTLAGGGWSDRMLVQINSVLVAAGASALTEFNQLSMPALSSVITDEAVDGGRYSIYPGTPIFTIQALSNVIIAAPTTTPFAVGFRGIIPTPQVLPNLSSFGIMDTAGTHFNWLYSYANQSATNLNIQCAPVAGGGALVTTSHVLNGTEHDYALVVFGGNVHALVDGVDVGSCSAAGGPTTTSKIVVACLRNGNTPPFMRVRRFGFGI